MDIEALLVDRIVEHYAKKLAEAHIVGDVQASLEVKEYIEGNYGTLALAEVAERAMGMIAAVNP